MIADCQPKGNVTDAAVMPLGWDVMFTVAVASGRTDPLRLLIAKIDLVFPLAAIDECHCLS